MRNMGYFVDLNPPDKTFITNMSKDLFENGMFQEFFKYNQQFWTDVAYDCYGDPLPYSVAIHSNAGEGSDDARLLSLFYQGYFRTLRDVRIVESGDENEE